MTDACRPAIWKDAQKDWRALYEPSELARPHPGPASVQSNEAGRGVNGFGHFPRKKSGSAAGKNPGNYHSMYNVGEKYPFQCYETSGYIFL